MLFVMNKPLRRSFVLFILLISVGINSSTAQGFVSVQGQILDKDSKEAIPLVIVSIQHGGFSTAVNKEGYFNFKFPFIVLDSAEVTIAALGYKSLKMNARDLSRTELNNLSLTKAPLIETTLGISNAKSLVQSAIDSMKSNNSLQALLQSGFYRETASLEDIGVVKIKEAVLRVERFPEEKDRPDRIKVLKNRQLNWKGQSEKVNSWQFLNGPAVACRAIETELPHFLTKNMISKYEYEVDSMLTYFDGLELYSVNFKPKSPKLRGGRVGKIYIEPSSRAIVRLEYELTKKGLNEVIGKGLSNVKLTGESLKYTSQYRNAGDYWVLAENNVFVDLVYEEKLDNKFKTRAHWELRYVAMESTDLKRGGVTDLELLLSTENFGNSRSLDSSIWGIHNFLPPTEEMILILDHLR